MGQEGVDEPALTESAGREALERTSFDLLVIGGGVIGAATAAHAAREGLAVALVDAGDFGSGTSSASSKLVHGGLRYLRLGDVRLVREAHRERRTLTGPVAPHLVHRLPFLLPLYRGGPFRPAFVQSGILLYSTLAVSRLNWLVQPERAGELVPALRPDGLRSCALYADAWTNDARLCLENVLAAAERGATVLNRAKVVSLVRSGEAITGAEVSVGGDVVPVAARVVVNAAGPWVDAVRRLEDPRAGTSVRLSKGAHVLVPGGDDWTAALTVPQDDVRVTFAVPWYGLLLLGTTDSDFEGDPGEVAVDEADVAQILDEAAVALPSSLLGRDAVRASFAGLRVLPLGKGATANARRETVFSVGPGGMLSVAGGKLTTYRKIALDALERVRSPLGLRRVDRRPFPLPGARGDAPPFAVEVDPEVEAHLRHLYGSRAAQVVQPARDKPALLERLHPGGPDIAAQASFAVTDEWATTIEDVVRRRTTVALRGLVDTDVVDRVARIVDASPARCLVGCAARDGEYRLDDPVVAGAAAEVPREGDPHVIRTRRGAIGQESGCRDQHPRRAEAALDAAVLEKRGLQRAQLVAVREALDGRDLAAFGLEREIGAAVHRPSVEQHHARAALRVVAALLRAGEPHDVADGGEEARLRLELDGVAHPVDRERCRDPHWPTALAGIGTSPPRARARAISIARLAITSAIARR